jgi:hypothetical protein
MESMAHDSLQRLARAGADNDAIAEERGLEAAIGELELDAEDVKHVAEQRALRAVMVESGRAGELAIAHAHGSNRAQGFSLSTAEKARLVFYTAVYMDGIALGLRAERIAPEILKSIRALVSYSEPDETADFERLEHGNEPDHHIYHDIVRIGEWLESRGAR